MTKEDRLYKTKEKRLSEETKARVIEEIKNKVWSYKGIKFKNFKAIYKGETIRLDWTLFYELVVEHNTYLANVCLESFKAYGIDMK